MESRDVPTTNRAFLIGVGLAALVAFLFASPRSRAADLPPLIPSGILFGNPERISPQFSPDGKRLAYHPTKHLIQAVAFEPARTEWVVVDTDVVGDFDAIARLNEGDFSIVSRDTADATWPVAFTSDRGPLRYYAWNRASK